MYVLFKLMESMLKVGFKFEDMYWYVSASNVIGFLFKNYVWAHLANMVTKIGQFGETVVSGLM